MLGDHTGGIASGTRPFGGRLGSFSGQPPLARPYLFASTGIAERAEGELPYFCALPALMMICKSFSFSLQMYSNKSISRTSVSLMVLVQGFVYAFGSSTVTSTSRLP